MFKIHRILHAKHVLLVLPCQRHSRLIVSQFLHSIHNYTVYIANFHACGSIVIFKILHNINTTLLSKTEFIIAGPAKVQVTSAALLAVEMKAVNQRGHSLGNSLITPLP